MEDSVCQGVRSSWKRVGRSDGGRRGLSENQKRRKTDPVSEKIQIREMGNGKAVADERLLVYLDEKGNGPEIGQRILVKGNVGFF